MIDVSVYVTSWPASLIFVNWTVHCPADVLVVHEPTGAEPLPPSVHVPFMVAPITPLFDESSSVKVMVTCHRLPDRRRWTRSGSTRGGR